jgi:hypothetical protein
MQFNNCTGSLDYRAGSVAIASAYDEVTRTAKVIRTVASGQLVLHIVDAVRMAATNLHFALNVVHFSLISVGMVFTACVVFPAYHGNKRYFFPLFFNRCKHAFK